MPTETQQSIEPDHLRRLARREGGTESAEIVRTLLGAADRIEAMEERMDALRYRVSRLKGTLQMFRAHIASNLEEKDD